MGNGCPFSTFIPIEQLSFLDTARPDELFDHTGTLGPECPVSARSRRSCRSMAWSAFDENGDGLILRDSLALPTHPRRLALWVLL